MQIDGIEITSNLPDMTLDEARYYVEYVRSRVTDTVTDLDIRESSDGGVDLNWTAHGEPFHRLRRITGYLTSDLRSWNDAKRAEERERVKHGVDVPIDFYGGE